MKKQLLIPAVFMASVFLLTLSCSRNSASHFYKNATAKYNLKDYKGAIKDFSKAIELQPDFAEAWYGKAICESKIFDFDDALKDFNKAAELDPSNKDIIFNRAYYVKQKTGDFKGAIEDYNLFIEKFGQNEDAFALNNRGFCKLKLGNYTEALNDINNSINVLANNPMAYKNRALVYLKIDSTEKACNDLKKALDLGFSKKFGKEAQELFDQYCNAGKE